jgi:hypothetical protein
MQVLLETHIIIFCFLILSHVHGYVYRMYLDVSRNYITEFIIYS